MLLVTCVHSTSRMTIPTPLTLSDTFFLSLSTPLRSHGSQSGAAVRIRTAWNTAFPSVSRQKLARYIDAAAALETRSLRADVGEFYRKLSGQLALDSEVPLLRVPEVARFRIMRQKRGKLAERGARPKEVSRGL